jgi:anthranilate synthase/aminodeoxychorismate synthase-like glutamine amidotransferase
VKVVLIDAFDSFVYIIEQYLAELGAEPVVIRSDPGNTDRVHELAPDVLVLGPGPGHPLDSGHVELVHEFAGDVPILGVCLGHQAIGCAYGATVSPAAHIMHGKTSTIDHDGRGMFADAERDQVVTRYHSLVVEDATLPGELEVSARSRDDGYIMAMRHRQLAVESVQFHPESITTQAGIGLFRSFLRTYVSDRTGEELLRPRDPSRAP